mmetsp:Transcript_78296/g.138805  ORF Transcript_78296/g.138805 Transcript_78296/m.138805 type:complete len:84 (-) Transcript_78296:120-371(-)
MPSLPQRTGQKLECQAHHINLHTQIETGTLITGQSAKRWGSLYKEMSQLLSGSLIKSSGLSQSTCLRSLPAVGSVSGVPHHVR